MPRKTKRKSHHVKGGGKDVDFTIAASLDNALNSMAQQARLRRGVFLSLILKEAEQERDPTTLPRTKHVMRYARLTKDGKEALAKLRKRWKLKNRKTMTGSAVIRRVVAQAVNRRQYTPSSIDIGLGR